MKKYIEKLQFITHDIQRYSHVEQARLACEAGSKWIQYRCLTKSDDDLLRDVNAIAEICDDWGATLIVTDHLHLLGKADIQGFHIENMEADFVGIRDQIGEQYTLGGSANTVNQLIRLAQEGVDYAGLGPFTLTTTKPNDWPFIGLAGYETAVKTILSESNMLPIIAVGGVTLHDVGPLLKTGVYGVAVSSAINQSEDLVEAYRNFYDEIVA